MHFPTFRFEVFVEYGSRTWSDLSLIAIDRDQVLINVRHKVFIIRVWLFPTGKVCYVVGLQPTTPSNVTRFLNEGVDNF